MTTGANLIETNRIIKFDTEIDIVKSSNRFNNNKIGRIVSISRNMIFLEDSKTKKIIKLAKKEISFFKVKNHFPDAIIPGKRLLGRPEEVIVYNR